MQNVTTVEGDNRQGQDNAPPVNFRHGEGSADLLGGGQGTQRLKIGANGCIWLPVARQWKRTGSTDSCFGANKSEVGFN